MYPFIWLFLWPLLIDKAYKRQNTLFYVSSREKDGSWEEDNKKPCAVKVSQAQILSVYSSKPYTHYIKPWLIRWLQCTGFSEWTKVTYYIVKVALVALSLTCPQLVLVFLFNFTYFSGLFAISSIPI